MRLYLYVWYMIVCFEPCRRSPVRFLTCQLSQVAAKLHTWHVGLFWMIQLQRLRDLGVGLTLDEHLNHIFFQLAELGSGRVTFIHGDTRRVPLPNASLHDVLSCARFALVSVDAYNHWKFRKVENLGRYICRCIPLSNMMI